MIKTFLYVWKYMFQFLILIQNKNVQFVVNIQLPGYTVIISNKLSIKINNYKTIQLKHVKLIFCWPVYVKNKKKYREEYVAFPPVIFPENKLISCVYPASCGD